MRHEGPEHTADIAALACRCCTGRFRRAAQGLHTSRRRRGVRPTVGGPLPLGVLSRPTAASLSPSLGSIEARAKPTHLARACGWRLGLHVWWRGVAGWRLGGLLFVRLLA